jgi:hypothetical protein
MFSILSNLALFALAAPPTGLQIDYMTEPAGLDRNRVHFTWQLSAERGAPTQVAAQVVVVRAQTVKHRKLHDTYTMNSCIFIYSCNSLSVERMLGIL